MAYLMLPFLITALTISNICAIHLLRRKKEFIASLTANWNNERTILLQSRREIVEKRDKLERENEAIKSGWFPASYNNTKLKNGYCARFKYTVTGVEIKSKIMHFTTYGVVFVGGGIVPFSDLLVYIDVK